MKKQDYFCPAIEILSLGDLDVIVTSGPFLGEDGNDIFDD